MHATLYQSLEFFNFRDYSLLFCTLLQELLKFDISLYKRYILYMGKVSKELIGASAAKIILSVLVHGDNYGYEILQKVKELSGGMIKWNEGSIYPVLKKMESQGLIKSYWRMEDKERPRKYYSLLEQGKVELKNEKAEWNMVHNILTKLWSPQT